MRSLDISVTSQPDTANEFEFMVKAMARARLIPLDWLFFSLEELPLTHYEGWTPTVKVLSDIEVEIIKIDRGEPMIPISEIGLLRPRNITVERVDDVRTFCDSLVQLLWGKPIIDDSSMEERQNGPRQKVVSESELEAYLNDGWIFVSTLSNGSARCVIERTA